ncbi:collagen-like protein [Streptomyces sp. NPDC101151]|uniref:collagen-like triple helix repeat-containing protein n=1 Tax=Streptomyces sp. NPDC101151 TaxID=3366115 RepID=UPI003809B226
MLPDSIPTVTVTGRYLTPDGTPLSGNVTFRAPAVLTFSSADVILGGPVTIALDATGAVSVTLPATDAPGMNPTGWAYVVTEQLAGVAPGRSYSVLLPAEHRTADLADLAPTDPGKANYVAVRGDSAYEVAVEQGFAGTVEQWLASLVGATGTKGDTGPKGATGADGPTGARGAQGSQGTPGKDGAAGVVQSVNGQSAAAVVLTAGDVGAISATAAGAAGGVAQLDQSGKVPASQLPASSGGSAVASVNGKTGAVVLAAGDVGAAASDHAHTAAQVGALGTATRGAALGVAPLDGSGDVPLANLPTAAIPSVWTPGDLGFKAWTFDPAVTDSAAQYCQIGYVYLMGIVLREAATLSRLCFYTAGNGATQPNNQSFAGLYNSSGARVAQTTSLNNWFSVNEGNTIECGLTANYSAAAGLYWVALLINGPSAATNGPGFARGAAAGTNPAGQARASAVSFIRHGRLSTTGLTALPASFAPASAIVPDANAIWAAAY